MKLPDEIVDDLWKQYQLGQVSCDHTDKQVFAEVLTPLVRTLWKIAGGGMFSETACIVAARDVLKIGDADQSNDGISRE